MEQTTEELKPCPFCGKPAILEELESDPGGYRFDYYCSDHQYCGGTTSRCKSERMARLFWNRRYVPPDINLESQGDLK